MIPILFSSSETRFTSNGLCRLRDCVECTVSEQRNGPYECNFTYPVNGQDFDKIQLGCIIGVVHDTSGDIQPFDIVGRTRPIDGKVEFHAVHISYRLNKLVASGTNITNIRDAFAMLEGADQYDAPPFYFDYHMNVSNVSGYMAAADGIPKSVRAMLGGVEGSILDTYGGEIKWDKFHVDLYQERGSLKPVVIRYSSNLLDYEDETDYSESYTAVIPYWAQTGDGVYPIVVKGDTVTATIIGYNGRTECVPLDLSDKFEQQPTKAQLESMAEQVLTQNRPYLPVQNIKIDFVQLQESEEYAQYEDLMKCDLCDTVRVIFPLYNVDGYFKIVKVTYDVLRERYTEMELGKPSTTLAEALGVSSFGSDGKPAAGQSATYEGSVLKFGNLRMYIGRKNVANTGRATITFPTGTFSQVITAIPFCGQGGFGGYDTTSVTELTTSKVTLYQYNSAGAAMDVGVVVIGLA